MFSVERGMPNGEPRKLSEVRIQESFLTNAYRRSLS